MTEDGQRIRVDENFVPSVVPSIIQDGNKITIHANSVEEARTMASKKLKRLHATPEQIQNYISKIDESLFQELQPEIRYDITLDINRFLLEALKIGYEYALLKFGDAYWDDPTALKIRNRLNCAISGKMQDTCERPPEASYVPDYLMQGLSRTPLIGAHWISITSTLHNQLVAHIFCGLSNAPSSPSLHPAHRSVRTDRTSHRCKSLPGYPPELSGGLPLPL